MHSNIKKFEIPTVQRYGDAVSTANLVVLDQKLSQPLTLEAWCVISVRRQLRRVSDCGMWTRIEKLPVPAAIIDRLKLLLW